MPGCDTDPGWSMIISRKQTMDTAGRECGALSANKGPRYKIQSVTVTSKGTSVGLYWHYRFLFFVHYLSNDCKATSPTEYFTIHMYSCSTDAKKPYKSTSGNTKVTTFWRNWNSVRVCSRHFFVSHSTEVYVWPVWTKRKNVYVLKRVYFLGNVSLYFT